MVPGWCAVVRDGAGWFGRIAIFIRKLLRALATQTALWPAAPEGNRRPEGNQKPRKVTDGRNETNDPKETSDRNETSDGKKTSWSAGSAGWQTEAGVPHHPAPTRTTVIPMLPRSSSWNNNNNILGDYERDREREREGG